MPVCKMNDFLEKKYSTKVTQPCESDMICRHKFKVFVCKVSFGRLILLVW